jgi:hypothetical protein
MDHKLPAVLLNPGDAQLRFKRTPEIEAWCVKSSGEVSDRAAKRRKRQYRFWTQYHEALLGRLVTKRKPSPHCDLIAFRTWQNLSVKNRLTIDGLNRSFKRGIVTLDERDDAGNRSGGVATWRGLGYQFRLLRGLIEDEWKDWLPEQKAMVCDHVRPIAEFYEELRRGERNDSA